MRITYMAMVARSALLGAGLITLAACATSSGSHDSLAENDQPLERVELADGGIAFGWVAPSLSDAGFRTALIEPVAFPPEGREAELLHDSDLSMLADELNIRLRRAVRERVPTRDTPASDTLRFRVAVTGLRAPFNEQDYTGLTTGEPLFPENLIAGDTPQRPVFILLELEASDSLTGAVLARSLRPGPTIVLSSDQRHVPLSELTPLLDNWVAQWAASVRQLLRDRATDSRSLVAGSS